MTPDSADLPRGPHAENCTCIFVGQIDPMTGKDAPPHAVHIACDACVAYKKSLKEPEKRLNA